MFLASFSIVSLTPLNIKPESSRDLTISTISSVSPFAIISIELLCEAEDEGRPDPKIFLCIPASAAADAVIILKELKHF